MKPELITIIASFAMALTAFVGELKDMGNSNYEQSPNTPLLTSTPYALPRPEDSFYSVDAEKAIAEGGPVLRIYKSGIFQSYVPLDVLTDGRPVDDRPLPGENTWQFIERHHLAGVIGKYTIEIAASQPLLAPHPWSLPKPGDPLYDADKEEAIRQGSKTIARL
jgi:hypothetical protein